MKRQVLIPLSIRFLVALAAGVSISVAAENARQLPKITVASDGRSFQSSDGRALRPFGMTYYRPGTGWAPQVWKKFDSEATRADFARMKELGVNCVRVFLTYGSFLMEPDRLSEDGLAKFDQFLEIAERAGIYIHPTGPDHWEGLPAWARTDRLADETVLRALETFWTELARRYRGKNVIFAYDLLNEPAVGWDTPPLRKKWNSWLENKYGSASSIREAWRTPQREIELGRVPVPEAKNSPGSVELLDYQLFREGIADEWTRRQVRAIKAADPDSLVTVGLIQWSVPVLLPQVSQYAAFRPERLAPMLDFMEIHFYPLNKGFYEYDTTENEQRNLAYLESAVREVARPGKPVVVAEFGWYGGGQLTINQGKHPPATEDQQARWCRKVIETTRGLACGWLNWGLYDQPEARDVSQLTGLLTSDGRLKAWGQEFRRIASNGLYAEAPVRESQLILDWNACITSTEVGNEFREQYFRELETAK
ncbi:MAG: cellulase family glycosylhydrolase [Verrucomicrobiia bacterium]